MERKTSAESGMFNGCFSPSLCLFVLGCKFLLPCLIFISIECLLKFQVGLYQGGWTEGGKDGVTELQSLLKSRLNAFDELQSLLKSRTNLCPSS